MVKKDKLSVVIPCFNVEAYIEECLESIKKQTYKNLEVFVINDGSTDDTLNVIKRTVGKDKRFNIIDQKNKGIGATRNYGIELSTSKYITFVDSDDYLDVTMYEEMMTLLKQENADIVVCDYTRFNDNINKTIKCGEIEDYGCSIYEKPQIMNVAAYCPWNKIYNINLFKDIKFPTNLKWEDLNAVVKVLSEAKKVVKVDKSLYFYRLNEKGETGIPTKRNMDCLYNVIDIVEYLKLKDNYDILVSEAEILATYQFQNGLHWAYNLYDFKEINKYINDGFSFLDKEFLKWRDSIALQERPPLTRFIKRHKFILKLFSFYKIMKRNLNEKK